MHQQFDVLVIGGGVIGLSAALAMAQRNYSVAIIEASALNVDTSVPDMRVYAINQASQALLVQLGVWSLVDRERISPYTNMYVWDSATGGHIDFDSRYVGEQRLGVILEESVLKSALLQAISEQDNIQIFANSIVDHVASEDHGVLVHSRQQQWQGKLLMIADGANSPTRQKLNVPLTTWSYEQTAVVATVATEKPHQQTAYQVFNSDGPLAFLPLINQVQNGHNTCSIVWSTTTKRAQHLLSLDDDAFSAELTQAFANKLGVVQVLSKRYQFPLHMRHVQQYSGRNWLLLGDCAHTIHPLAGLGLNLGLADLHSWIQCMESTKGQAFSSKQLAMYQRNRKHAVWQTIMLMEGFKQLFGSKIKPLTSLRGIGMALCNNIRPLKRLFIQHAAG